ncbi:MAG: protein kinase [Planctomycetes bacterium]|nr:protein kinase [Planctomycetota bacterium]
MPCLVIEKGPDKGKVLKLVGRDTILIGRETTAQIRLNDIMASRLHFKIDTRSNGHYMVDLGSMNGTLVNGKRVKEKLLKIGDKIQVGETIISFLSDSERQKEGGLIGQTIGGCQVIERVGRGGMGTVYKAKQISLNRIVALKLLAPELVRDKTFINLFVKEARSAAQLNHTNIVQVYDIGKFKNWYYFLMEFVPGGSIQEMVSRKKKLPPETAIAMMIDAARGLEYAEKKGIVHRDIKPDNLMIGEDNRVKISDLGLAKNIHVEGSTPAEGEGVFGTPHYIAPEQALNKAVDHRADIYSLGATFYRIVTGVTPYSGNSIREIIIKKTQEDPPPVKTVNESLPDELCAIIEKMIQRNPEKRYQKASELIAELKNIKAQLTGKEYPTVPVSGKANKTSPINLEPKPLFPRMVIPAILTLLSLLTIFVIISYYYASVKPDQVSHLIVRPNGDDQEEKKARSYLEEAEEFVKKMDRSKKKELKKAIALYRRILTEYPESSFRPKADREINILSAQVKNMRTDEEKAIEKVARQEYQTLRNQMDRRNANIGNELLVDEVSGFIKNSRESLTNLKNKYPDTDVSALIDEHNKKLSEWYARFRTSRKSYNTTLDRVKEKTQQKQFRAALALVDDFIQNTRHKNTLFDRIILKDKKQVITVAQISFRNLLDEVNSLVDQEKYESAKLKLTKALSNYGPEELTRLVRKKITGINGLIERQQKEQQRQILETDRRIFISGLAKTLRAAQQGWFNDALVTLKSLKNRPMKTTEYQNKVELYIQDLEMERDIMEKLKTKVNSGQLAQAKFKNYLIKKATVEEIIVVTEEGQEVPYPWEGGVEPKELYNLIRGGWDLTPEDYISLGVLCMKRGGLTEEARELFKTAHARLLDNPTYPNADFLSLQINDVYIPRSRTEKKNREKEARQFLDQAEKLISDKDYHEAINNLLLIKHRYKGNIFYQQQKERVEQNLIECQKNL